MAGINQPARDPANRPTERRDSLLALHRSLLEADPSAETRIADTIVPLLIARLRRRWPLADHDAIDTAVHDAVLSYLAEPSRYDCRKARLDVFLGRVAHRRLQDARRQDRRRSVREVPLDLVTRTAVEGASHPVIEDKHPSDSTSARRRLMLLAKSQVERRFLTAYLAGESRQRCAKSMGLAHLEADEQTSAVHRMIARLHQRALRSKRRRI